MSSLCANTQHAHEHVC